MTINRCECGGMADALDLGTNRSTTEGCDLNVSWVSREVAGFGCLGLG